MRIMIDSNILISALLFPNGQTAKALQKCIIDSHDLVISTYVIDELKRVVKKKFPKQLQTVEMLLDKMTYELIYTPDTLQPDLFSIRDPKDYPVLYTAIKENVDIMLTGDADFKATDVKHPIIVTPTEFLQNY